MRAHAWLESPSPPLSGQSFCLYVLCILLLPGARTQNFPSRSQQSHSDPILADDECMQVIPPTEDWVNISSAELSLIFKLQGEAEVCIVRGLISKWGFIITKLISGLQSIFLSG